MNPFEHLSIYEISNLIPHLPETANFDLIHKVLCLETIKHKNGWYEVCLFNNIMENYQRDLDIVFGIVRNDFDNLALQIRYALMKTTIHLLAGITPVAIWVSILKNQCSIISGKQMLDTISHMPILWQIADALHDIAPYLPKILHPEALDMALKISIENEKALQRVTRSVPEERQILFLESVRYKWQEV